MNKYLLLLIFLSSGLTNGQAQIDSASEDYWTIKKDQSILWNVKEEDRLPHAGNIEMAGKNIAGILYYSLDEKGKLSVSRDIIAPQLRTYNKVDEPDWKKYRAYFRRTIDDAHLPSILLNGEVIVPKAVDSISINGSITFYHSVVEDLLITRKLFPSMESRFFVEKWVIKNLSNVEQTISIANSNFDQEEIGYKGNYSFVVKSNGQKNVQLESDTSYEFPIYFGATLNNELYEDWDFLQAEKERDEFLTTIRNSLVLKTPDPILNQLFYFSKIRASESIYHSSLGLIHSPGGGNYYLGIWANDQVEYSGPFFPYLNFQTGKAAALNTYKKFKESIPTDDSAIPYAFEVDGNFPMNHLERGDAAMLVYGTSHYALTTGDKKIAKELWPLISWSMDWCHNHLNSSGVVISESDEMEGRIETGSANLSTSSLYYGGLSYAIPLARELGYDELLPVLEQRKTNLQKAINSYFGANIEGLDTYKYFKEHQYLRHWICLPLMMGITEKKEATLTALFDKLWTDNGILVELNPTAKQPKSFWDRATLYAMTGALKVGAANRTYEKLHQYSQKRLLGDHVPYVVEAYPENNMKHLSAESALYCRIFLEGFFGIKPIGFNKFKIAPSLPDHWNEIELKDIQLGNEIVDIRVTQLGKKMELLVSKDKKTILTKRIATDDWLLLDLN